jgi:hypothetical protein
MNMNTIDESFLCSTCGEQYAYCGCPNDEAPEPVDGFAVCAVCDFTVRGLFYLNGDSTGRCDYCHNSIRMVGVSTTEADWF